MTYTHDFSVTFTVEGSTDERGSDLSDARLLEALKALVAGYEAKPGLLRYEVSRPVDTRENRLWMMRQIDEPGCVRLSDGGWNKNWLGGLRREDMLTSEQARTMELGEDAFWCPPEDIHGMGVIARVRTDDGVVDTRFDVRPWLKDATAEEIIELAEDGWSLAESADRVAMFLEGYGEPEASKLFIYLAIARETGFGVSVPAEAAMDWLAEVRPDVFEQVESALHDRPEP